ncbi:MAG: rhomboid family intramembrane serine protease [Acidobacteriia bacterium]|nr:rhomboid family intramembrane serine protease [Terriglobia bacterium]
MDKRRMCPNCRAFITSDDKICPYCQAQVGERIIDRRSPSDALGGLIPHQRFVTMLILLINTGLYVATMLRTQQQGGGGFGDPSMQTLVDFGAKYAPFIFYRGEWWRLITAAFLHGGLLHILMNSWVLFDLGPQVNQAFGTPRFLSIYFVSSVTGFLASLYWSPAVSIGASAGLCGLIGAMIAFGTRERSAFGSALRRQYVQWMIYLLIFGLVIPNVDNSAHLGGLAGGFVVAYLAGTPGFSEAKENFWRLAAGLSLAATGWAFFEMFMHLTSTTT